MNVANMACEEVNEALAKFQGDPHGTPIVVKDEWRPIIGADLVSITPDYCHDWKWAGKVLEEMLIRTDLYEVADWIYASNKCVSPEAIARTSLQMYLDADEQPT